MNFAAIAPLVITGLQLAPQVVAGVEYIHKEAPGATKQQLATDSLNLATAAAQALLPQDEETIAAVQTLVKGIIDATVKGFNISGLFTHKAA